MKIILAPFYTCCGRTRAYGLSKAQKGEEEDGILSSVAPADDWANRTGWSAFHDPTFPAACVRKVHARRAETNLLTQTRCEDSFLPPSLRMLPSKPLSTFQSGQIVVREKKKLKVNMQNFVWKFARNAGWKILTISRERKLNIIMWFLKFLFCRISPKVYGISRIKYKSCFFMRTDKMTVTTCAK